MPHHSRKPELLSPIETFENYENKSRPVSQANSMHSVQGMSPNYRYDQGVLACEYRQDPRLPSHPAVTSEYAREKAMRDPAAPVLTTTFIGDSRQKKFPVGAIICVSVCVPIFIIICLFGAVQLQELGML